MGPFLWMGFNCLKAGATSSRLSILIYLFWNAKVYLKQTYVYLSSSRFSKLIYIIFKLRSLRYTSFQQNSRRTNKVLLRYKQSINLFFLFLYFSNTSHEPYLKYTYSMLPTVFHERGNCIVVSLQYFCLKK